MNISYNFDNFFVFHIYLHELFSANSKTKIISLFHHYFANNFAKSALVIFPFFSSGLFSTFLRFSFDVSCWAVLGTAFLDTTFSLFTLRGTNGGSNFLLKKSQVPWSKINFVYHIVNHLKTGLYQSSFDLRRIIWSGQKCSPLQTVRNLKINIYFKIHFFGKKCRFCKFSQILSIFVFSVTNRKPERSWSQWNVATRFYGSFQTINFRGFSCNYSKCEISQRIAFGH